ncbi:hypothetical protein ACIPMZ_22495 [Scandinavium goeteborgense]|jgi:hypothetical protein|uniref:hypothetical protein n=1 Tax=Scandinavium goeteborgense TaxID=1851514 RepID=UPI003816264B
MMNKINNVACLLPLIALSGCVLSEDLSPPPDAKMVNIAVVKPAELDILPMDVIYRSEKCRDKIFTSTGSITTRPGYHLLTVSFKPDAGSNTVSNKVALDGGGQCEWMLSNVKIEFQYSDMTLFGQDVKENIPNDIVFVFDKNAPSRGNGHYENIHTSTTIEKDYYPLIKKGFTNDGMSVLNIQGQPMLTYRIYDANNIIFKPNLNSDLLVNVLTPKKRGDGYTLSYPNGETVIDHHFPNSEKTKYEFVKTKSR